MARGRPRGFDPDTVLETVVELLWRSGPHGLSLNDLSRDLGVTKPALAAVFGGKDALVARALRRYHERVSALADAAIAGETSPDKIAEAYIRTFAGILAEKNEHGPTGCLLAAASETYACAIKGPVRETIDVLNEQQYASLRAALEAAGAPDPDGQARFILGQTTALALFFRAGVGKAALMAFVERAIAASRT